MPAVGAFAAEAPVVSALLVAPSLSTTALYAADIIDELRERENAADAS